MRRRPQPSGIVSKKAAMSCRLALVRTVRLTCVGIGGGAALATGVAAHATTLAEAVSRAYQTNPSLQIERSQLRALDEEYVQAFAAYRPTLSVSAQGQYTFNQERLSPGEPTVSLNENALTTGVSASQLLYNGGRTAAQVSAAEADILSGREQLRLVEGNTMLAVIQAYVAVLRDQSIFNARRLAVDDYQAQVDEVEARFAAGNVTRTDVEQAQSQLASGRSDLANAQGSLESSRAAYVAAVGDNPGQLEPPPPLPGVPANIDDAFSASVEDSPQVLGAVLDERASRERVREEKAQNMPSVGAQLFYGYQGVAVPFAGRDFYRSASATVSVGIPLFTGGLNSSNIRQAQEQNVSKTLQIENVRRSVIQTVATSWNGASAASRAEVADQTALERAEGSERGMKIEYRGGLRSTLEVLTEEERLEAAQVAVATDEYNDYVERATLLNAMGRLQVIDFTKGVPLYDSARNLKKVRNVGATPLDGVFAAADHVGEPGVARKPIVTPPPAKSPEIIQTNPSASAPLPFSDLSPLTPSFKETPPPTLR